MRIAAGIAAALATTACCRPCAPPPPTPPTAFYNDGHHGDVRGGRPENVFAPPVAPPAVRRKYFDVRDLLGAGPPDVELAPSSTTFEPDTAPPATPEWRVLADLRALAPGTNVELKGRTVIARGPTDELAAIGRHLDALRRAAAPPK